MRIISGLARGIRLLPPRSTGVRPTTDRVKESLFGSLEPLAGLTVVDLFAGSGALGLEACSRGAAAVYLVEQSARECRLIEANLARVRRAAPETGEVEVVRAPVAAVAARLPGVKPDIILADPPYVPARGEWGGQELVRDRALWKWAGDALLVVEQSRHALLDLEHARWEPVREKRFGDTVLSYLRPRPATPEHSA